ncbi:methyl-accepting chemotaxis protein [Natronobacterium texcoconense]|uniref:Methyl-accepting chemotaxis sensory transducer with Pas/Pac sensor n=1 Tax=Natronobacterium texcoconense TaxID=1095778 RepID=A0A1H1ESV2_NATTX|nr:methyl-accepting chemotaxis protein [Natronobacterium texcoconense]SDQ91634.1 methyl-accepting chemotaxis sensory transducer with Pas/Pac sensor [Natronobacterium texcoconense]
MSSGDAANELNQLVEHTERFRERIEETTDASRTQADYISGLAKDVNDVSATMEEIASSATEIVDMVEEASETAESGLEAGRRASEQTQETVDDVADLVAAMERVSEQMEEIGTVTELIADIADQTNLLALNANIEAAHAGDEGAGFTVVANEVKTLAEETGENADEIRSLIESLESETEAGMEAAERTHSSVLETADDIDTALEAIDEAVSKVEEVMDGATEIADANDVQAGSIEEFAARIEDLGEESDEIRENMSDAATLVDQHSSVVEHASGFLHGFPGLAYRTLNEDGWPVVFATNGIEELAGYTAEQLVEGEIVLGEDVIHEDDQEAVWEAIQDLVDRNGTAYDITYRMVTRRGEVKTVRERGRPIYDDQGELEAFEGYIWNTDESETQVLFGGGETAPASTADD